MRLPGAGTPDVGVVVLGSLNTDLVVEVPRLPAPGETVAGGDVRQLPGGKGANQAVAARRLGAAVHLVGAVGDDRLGAALLDGLAAEGVDVSGVEVLAGRPSGVALITVETGGENTIAVAPGANAAVGPTAVAAAGSALAAHAGPAVLLLQLEVPVAGLLSAARAAVDAGRPVVLNAAPLAAPAPPEVRELARACDLVVVNEQEAAALAGGPGPERVVVTLGRRGARWSDRGASGSCPAFPVASVDAVGAGDTFTAAVAVALAGGLPLEDAVRRGCAAGALATAGVGAQAAMPTAAQVDRLLEEVPGAR